MFINSNFQVSHSYQVQNTNTNNSNNAGVAAKDRTAAATDTVSISNAGLNANDKWQDIANKYDVTNISQNEAGSMVSELFDNKIINSTDALYLMAPRAMNINPEVKFDFLATARKSLDFLKQNGGSPEGIKNQENALATLNNIHELFRKA
ncbi:MAG: hypothetical protein OEM38_07015 [Gammaproteobacteria bacterium]|nr:hypothetical protein [Gammaproteobacteria bacterium]